MVCFCPRNIAVNELRPGLVLVNVTSILGRFGKGSAQLAKPWSGFLRFGTTFLVLLLLFLTGAFFAAAFLAFLGAAFWRALFLMLLF